MVAYKNEINSLIISFIKEKNASSVSKDSLIYNERWENKDCEVELEVFVVDFVKNYRTAHFPKF